MWRDNMIERGCIGILQKIQNVVTHKICTLFSLQYKLTPIRGSKSYISVIESSGDMLLLTAEALRLLMVVGKVK